MTTAVRSLGRRLQGFAGASAISLVASLALFAVLARAASHEQWVALALGQSIGGIASLVAGCGWTLTGPAQVATLSTDEERLALYRDSLGMRVIAVCVLAAPVALITWFLAREAAPALAVATGLATLLTALSANWYNVGRGDAAALLRYDTAPRVLAVLLAAAMVLSGGSVYAFPALLAAAVSTSSMWFSRHLLGRKGGPSPAVMDRLRSRILRQGRATAAEFVGALYTNASVALVSLGAPIAEVARFSAGLRIYQASLLSVTALGESLQAWTTEGLGDHRSRRVFAAFSSHAMLALVGGLALATMLPVVTATLFTAANAVGADTARFLGFAFALVSINTTLVRHVFLPAGHQGVVFAGMLVGAAVGVPATIRWGAESGAAGGAMGVAAAQLAVLIVHATWAWRLWGRAARP